MACRGIVKLRRGLLLWPLVGPTRATAWRASVASTEVSKNRIHGSNASSLRQCPSVADENPENIRTTSMMGDCNARALTPLRKSSIAVLPARHDLRTSVTSTEVSARTCSSPIPAAFSRMASPSDAGGLPSPVRHPTADANRRCRSDFPFIFCLPRPVNGYASLE